MSKTYCGININEQSPQLCHPKRAFTVLTNVTSTSYTYKKLCVLKLCVWELRNYVFGNYVFGN